MSAAKSKVIASPTQFQAASIPGTGITVEARDADNNLIGGATIALSSSGADPQFGSTTLVDGTSGATLGRATTTYTSTKAEVKTISADITASGITVAATPATVTVNPGDPDAAKSTVTASAPAAGLANSSTITITVKDVNGNLAGTGHTVGLAIVGATPGAVLPQPNPTNSSGVTTGSLKSTTGGVYTVKATIDGSTIVTQQPTVTFLLSFATDIKVGIFDTPFNLGGGVITGACSGCHLPDGTGQDPPLNFANITNSHENVGFIVVPGDAASSLLIKALLHDPSLDMDELMPRSDQFLPDDVIARIRQWINQNGLNQALTQ